MFSRNAAIGWLVVVAAVVSTVRVSPQAGSLTIVHVNVVEIGSGRILPNATVTISGQEIASVTPDGRTRAAVPTVDGQGKFLIPGLWDMHAHMEASGPAWLQLYVVNGVTGIRDMGSALDFIINLREGTSSHRILGPRIFAAGPILDDAPGDWPFRMRVKTADDGRAAVQFLKRRGVDLIKVHDHTPREAFVAIADEARRQDLPLAGHLPLGIKPEEAIDAGQLDIEHLSNMSLWRTCSGGAEYRADNCHGFFEMLARKNVWQTPTLVAWSELASICTSTSMVSADRFAYATKSIRAMWAGNQSLIKPESTAEIVRAMRADAVVGAAVTADMAKAGVRILAGCDTMIAGFCVHDELAAMVRGGMTPLQALQTATLNPARYFGLEATSGSVTPGKRADLVLLDADPLIDITNVGRIRSVVLAGRLLDRKELDKLLSDAKRAASE
jgi:hypothetical protein